MLPKLDVKSFHRSGERARLTKATSPAVGPDRRSLLEQPFWTILHYQFVMNNQQRYRVELGTGMGLIHSRSLSDLALWRIAEKHLRSRLGERGIHGHIRLRDDIFVVAGCDQDARQFAQLLGNSASGVWKIEEGIRDRFSTPFLDLLIYKGFASKDMARAGARLTTHLT